MLYVVESKKVTKICRKMLINQEKIVKTVNRNFYFNNCWLKATEKHHFLPKLPNISNCKNIAADFRKIAAMDACGLPWIETNKEIRLTDRPPAY